jgi:hypothetical protein
VQLVSNVSRCKDVYPTARAVCSQLTI